MICYMMMLIYACDIDVYMTGDYWALSVFDDLLTDWLY